MFPALFCLLHEILFVVGVLWHHE